MKILLILIAILIAPSLVHSQTTISGKVESTGGTPVPGASVFLIQGNMKSRSLTILSDSTGEFRMPVADSVFTSKWFIYSSYLNVKSDTLSVTGSISRYVLRMHLNETLLPGVTVESRAPVVQRMADRFIFTPDKQLTQGANALDVMKFAPMVQYDEKSSLFSIINKEGTVVYINNRKSNLPKEMIISTLRSTSASDIRNIEIITNPGSEYSANTSGGVININFKKMFDEGWSGNMMAASEQSNFNTSVLNGAVNYRKGKAGVRLSPFFSSNFNYYSRDNLIAKNNNEQEDIISERYRRYKVFGGGLGFDYDISKKSLLSFNGFYSTVSGKSRNANVTIETELGIPADSLRSSPFTGKDHYTYNFGNLYYQHYLDRANKRSLTINIDYNQFNQGNKNNGQFISTSLQGSSKETGRYRNDLPQDFFNLSERIDYTSQINSKSKINFGIQYSNTNVSNNLKYYDWDYYINQYFINQNLTTNYKYREDYLAGYLSYTKTFTDKLNGVFGLRAEQINYTSENVKSALKADTNYLGLFPNLSLAYAINKKNNISLSLSKKIRRPNIEQLFPGRTYYNQDYLQENNPFLQPVTSYSADFMYALKNRYYFSSGYTVYKNQFTQFIIPLFENNTEKLKRTYLNYGNTGNAYFSFFSQLEFVKKVWSGSISANLNYSTFRIKEQDALFYTKDLSNVNYNAVWNNTIYISEKGKWVGFATFRYYSPVKNIVYKRENSLFATDLGVRKTIKNFSISLFLSDLFNTNGRSKLLYIPNPAYSYNFLDQKTYTQSIAVNIRYSFGNNKLRVNKSKSSANEDIKNRIGN